MRKTIIVSFALVTGVICFGQQPQQRPGPPNVPGQKQEYPARMTPQMTEIMEPEVKVIQPGEQSGMAPSDAIVLFDGSAGIISQEWEDSRGNPTKWILQDGALVCVKGSGVIQTKRKFEDFQLHIEWRAPAEVIGDGQGRGNSGVYLQGL